MSTNFQDRNDEREQRTEKYLKTRKSVLLGLTALRPNLYAESFANFTKEGVDTENATLCQWQRFIIHAQFQAIKRDDLLVLQEICHHELNIGLVDSAALTAVNFGHIDSFQVLLKYGADPDATDNLYKTYLMICASCGRGEFTRLLCSLTKNINKKCKGEQTCLMYAARYGQSECVQIIIDAGVDVNLATHLDQTALTFAIVEEHFDCARALCNAGAIYCHDAFPLKKDILEAARANGVMI